MNLKTFKWIIWKRINKFYEIDTLRRSRRKFASEDLKRKDDVRKCLNYDEWKEVVDFWKPYYNVSKEKKWYEFYHGIDDSVSNLKYYIPDSIYYMYVDLFFSHARKAMVVDDKNLYDLFFYDVRMPNTILRKNDGVYLNKSYDVISEEQAIQMVKVNNVVISKQPTLSEGGHGVLFWDFQKDSLDHFYEWLHDNPNTIIQEVVRQHQSLSAIHKDSINTIRIMTIIMNNTVRIVSSVLRMGVNGSKVDNASSGGLVCGINADGSLKGRAFDTKGKVYYSHPQSGKLTGIEIPGFHKCCDLARRLAPRFVGVSRLVSWDFSVGEDTCPILIEVNLGYGQIDFHQMCNGPIFGEYTEEVLKLVFGRNE